MRAVVVFLMLVGITSSCTKKDDLSPFSISKTNSGIPLGRYQLMFYENVADVPYEVILEIKGFANADGDYLINGRSAVNFYFSTSKIEASQNAFSVHSLGSTKIAGGPKEVAFEQNYFNRLSAVRLFELKNSGNSLILYSDESKESFMTFRKAEIPQ